MGRRLAPGRDEWCARSGWVVSLLGKRLAEPIRREAGKGGRGEGKGRGTESGGVEGATTSSPGVVGFKNLIASETPLRELRKHNSIA